MTMLLIVKISCLSLINIELFWFLGISLIIFISIVLIIVIGIHLAALPLADLLNIRETTPDWALEERRQQEQRDRDDELMRRLKAQALLECVKITRQQRNVYDPTFPPNAVLTPELINELHIRPKSLLLYELRTNVLLHDKLYPKPENRVGYRNSPVRAVDYLNATNEQWFNNNR